MKTGQSGIAGGEINRDPRNGVGMPGVDDEWRWLPELFGGSRDDVAGTAGHKHDTPAMDIAGILSDFAQAGM